MRIGSRRTRPNVRDLMGRDERARRTRRTWTATANQRRQSRTPRGSGPSIYSKRRRPMGSSRAGEDAGVIHPSRRRRIGYRALLDRFSEEFGKTWVRQHGRCVYCVLALRYGHRIDHIVPRARSGSDRLSNLQLLCPFCNALKGDQTDGEFRVISHSGAVGLGLADPRDSRHSERTYEVAALVV